MKSRNKILGALVLSQAALFATNANSGVVYTNDFTSGDVSNWSVNAITTAPTGEKFFGELGNSTATLTLNGLAAHSNVSISFDLYILKSWDGNGQHCCGPDTFTFSANGTTLFNETFSNTSNAGNIGSFSNTANVTQTATNSLGYQFWGDSTYRFNFDIADAASTLQLSFTGAGLQSLNDESWGLDNFTISTDSASVSEPGTLALLGLGLAGLGLVRRKV